MQTSPRRRRRSREGLTLLELAVLLSVVGVVVAAFVPTFLREVRLSKVAEASENLAEMHRRAAAYYAARHSTPEGRRSSCVVEPAGPAPAEPSEDPQPIDFASPETAGHATWEALEFSPPMPVRYRYSLAVTADEACGPRAVAGGVELRFVAEGDLDGDGVLSRFERRASNAEDPSELIPVGPLRTTRRVE